MNKKKPKELDQVNQEIFSKGTDAEKDFLDSEEVKVTMQRRANKLISIRLPIQMIKDLRRVARECGDIGYQQLIKLYIAEGLRSPDARISPARSEAESTNLSSTLSITHMQSIIPIEAESGNQPASEKEEVFVNGS